MRWIVISCALTLAACNGSTAPASDCVSDSGLICAVCGHDYAYRVICLSGTAVCDPAVKDDPSAQADGYAVTTWQDWHEGTNGCVIGGPKEYFPDAGTTDVGANVPDAASDGGLDAGVGYPCAHAGTPCETCSMSDPEEFAVLSVLIDKEHGGDPRLVIRSRSWWAPAGTNLDGFVDGATDAEQATRDDMKRKNGGGQEYCLEGTFAITPQYQVADPETFSAMLGSIADASHPDGLLWVARVGFNADKTEALAYTGYRCGGLCGGGTVSLLRKVNGVWQYISSSGGWAS